MRICSAHIPVDRCGFGCANPRGAQPFASSEHAQQDTTARRRVVPTGGPFNHCGAARPVPVEHIELTPDDDAARGLLLLLDLERAPEVAACVRASACMSTHNPNKRSDTRNQSTALIRRPLLIRRPHTRILQDPRSKQLRRHIRHRCWCNYAARMPHANAHPIRLAGFLPSSRCDAALKHTPCGACGARQVRVGHHMQQRSMQRTQPRAHCGPTERHAAHSMTCPQWAFVREEVRVLPEHPREDALAERNVGDRRLVRALCLDARAVRLGKPRVAAIPAWHAHRCAPMPCRVRCSFSFNAQDWRFAPSAPVATAAVRRQRSATRG